MVYSWIQTNLNFSGDPLTVRFAITCYKIPAVRRLRVVRRYIKAAWTLAKLIDLCMNKFPIVVLKELKQCAMCAKKVCKGIADCNK